MKQLLSHLLIFSILSSSFSISRADSKSDDCENGECVPKIVSQLEEISKLYQSQCLPKQITTESEIKSYYLSNGVSENCWKYLTEINHLEEQLQKIQPKLEAKLGCENANCNLPSTGGPSLNAQLAELSKVEQSISCTEDKKRIVRSTCGDELKCTVISSALGMGGYIAEKLISDKYKMKRCHMGDDSCATQLTTGFIKSVFSFFEGAWDLLKSAKGYVSKKAGEFWDYVSGADNHASTSQLAMAQASEEGVLDLLIKDFPGTMSNIYEGFIAALKEWMKTDVFCQKWEGVPHFGRCLEPVESFDCISCKAMVTGICSLSGAIIAEIVPAFLTGGVATAAKHGVNGASKLAKLFRVSDKTLDALKASRVTKLITHSASKVDDVLKVTRGLKLAKASVEAALVVIKSYLLSPTRKLLKSTASLLIDLAKKGSMHMAQTKGGKILLFAGKTLKTSGEVILYPIDNPMTTWAFKAGGRSFEKVFKLGAPSLVTTSEVINTLIKTDKTLESLLIKLEEAHASPKLQSTIAKLEQELLSKIQSKRMSLLEALTKDNKLDFDEMIQHLFPELKYGSLGKHLGSEKILQAEKELLDFIQQLPDGAFRNELLRKFELHVANSTARKKIVGKARPGGVKLPEDDYENLKAVKLPKMSPVILDDMMKNKHYTEILSSVDSANRKTTAKSLRLLEQAGFKPKEVSLLYKKHEKYFLQVQKSAPIDSDAPSMLAEFLRRQKKAGLSDELIEAKLSEAFKLCD